MKTKIEQGPYAHLINEELKEAVALAISQEELKTSGEIVVVIAPSSSSVFYTTTLILNLLFMALVFCIFFIFYEFGITLPLLVMVFVLILCPFLAQVLSRKDFVQRLFLHPHDKRNNVFNRAQLEFFKHRLHKTEKSTGVLIYLSLLEREAVIWGDTLIASKLNQESWDTILKRLIFNLKKNDLKLGLTKAISEVGQILTTHFPVDENDKNEISNKLIVLD